MQHETVLYEAESQYGHYTVVDMTYGGRPARVLYSGNHQAAQSGVARDDRPDLLFDYNERFLELVRGLRPQRVLLIGAGACTLPVALQAEFPNIHLTIVEIDAELLKIAEAFFDFAPGPRTAVHIVDGRKFLAQDGQQYDLIILDVFSNAAVPLPFQTVEAAREYASHLRPGGVLAMNIIASYYGERSRTLRRQVACLQASFSNLQLFPAGHEPSLWLPQNFVLTAHGDGRDLRRHLRYSPVRLPLVDDSEALHDEETRAS